MSLKLRFILYLAAVHVLMAATGALWLTENRLWLLAVEAVLVVSFLVGFRLLRSLFGTLAVVRAGAEFIAERDFSARFPETGVPEMDALVRVYNSMAEKLRDERVKTEEQRHFLDRVLAVSPLGIITLDYDGRIASTNPAAARMLRSEASTLQTKRLAGLGDSFADELSALSPNESRVLALWGSRRFRCHRGDFMDRGFHRGYYTLEELTEELRQTEKTAYEKLIRIMSHEVNNSVGAAGSLLQSCLHYRDQLSSGDRQDFERALGIVIARTAQLNSFMREFAEIFRVPAPRKQSCEVPVLLDSAAGLMAADLGVRRITVRRRMGGITTAVSADRGQMEQVFVNLLKNAVEAIGQDGSILLETGLSDGRPFAAVEDTGSGMTDEIRAQLFTPFFSTKQSGQGIGLTLVREVLERHGFDFAVESRPGGPTRFTVYF